MCRQHFGNLQEKKWSYKITRNSRYDEFLLLDLFSGMMNFFYWIFYPKIFRVEAPTGIEIDSFFFQELFLCWQLDVGSNHFANFIRETETL